MKAYFRKVLYVAYQPYKYIVFAPSVVACTAFFGSLAMPSEGILQRAGCYKILRRRFCAGLELPHADQGEGLREREHRQEPVLRRGL